MTKILQYLIDRGKFQTGLDYADEFLAFARNKRDGALESAVLNLRGTIYLELGMLDEAEKNFLKVIETGVGMAEAKARANLAKVLNLMGKNEEAHEMITKAIEHFYKVQEAHSGENLSAEKGYCRMIEGDILLDIGKSLEAREKYSKAHHILSKSHNSKGMGIVCLSIARAYIRTNDRISLAENYARKAFDAFLDGGGYLPGETDALKIMAFVQFYLADKHEDALRLLKIAKNNDEYMGRNIRHCEFNEFFKLIKED